MHTQKQGNVKVTCAPYSAARGGFVATIKVGRRKARDFVIVPPTYELQLFGTESPAIFASVFEAAFAVAAENEAAR